MNRTVLCIKSFCLSAYWEQTWIINAIVDYFWGLCTVHCKDYWTWLQRSKWFSCPELIVPKASVWSCLASDATLDCVVLHVKATRFLNLLWTSRKSSWRRGAGMQAVPFEQPHIISSLTIVLSINLFTPHSEIRFLLFVIQNKLEI